MIFPKKYISVARGKTHPKFDPRAAPVENRILNEDNFQYLEKQKRLAVASDVVNFRFSVTSRTGVRSEAM